MDSGFHSHLDQLLQHLKTQVVQHYERDLAAGRTTVADDECSISKPHILGLQRKAPDSMYLTRSPKFLLKRPSPDSESDEDLLPNPRIQPRFASKKAVADDSDVSQGTADSVELKTPHPGSQEPRFPKPHPFSPFSPHTPQMPPTQLIPVTTPAADSAPPTLPAIPHDPEKADGPIEPKVEKVEKVEKGSSDSSDDSFSTTSTPNDEMPEGPVPNRCRVKRVSNASFSEFFKRQATVTDLYLFMQDEDSSKAAWFYAQFMNLHPPWEVFLILVYI